MKRPTYKNPRYAKAVDEQEALVRRVVIAPLSRTIRLVGGADVSFYLHGSTFWGGFVVCDALSNYKVVDSAVFRMEVDFPYIPGLLGFREVPVLVEAYRRLGVKPGVTIVDAHGIAHPRGFGSASHLGVVLNVPTVGCAKNLLCGSYEEPAPERGCRRPLVLDGNIVGAAVRTRNGVKVVYVSPGHLSDIESSVRLTLDASPNYRISEPVRRAHALVNEARLTSPDTGGIR